MSDLIISSSGIRGIVAKNLGPEYVLKAAKAFAQFIGSGPIIIGGDTRTSHDMLCSAAVSGVLSQGIDVIEIGKVPTPTCQIMCRELNASAALIITASHNPAEWNGIKLMDGEGAFLSPEDFKRFESEFLNAESPKEKAWDQIGRYQKHDSAIEEHIQHIFKVIDPTPIREAKLRVYIDPNHGTGAIATPKLLDALGVDYDGFGLEGDGLFEHAPEPTKENLAIVEEKMKAGGYDIGFAQDPDADRLVIFDENGQFIGEDYSLGFCIDYLLSISTSPKSVVVNCSTSLVIADIAEMHGATIHYTKIGETHVSQKIRSENASVGGEGNGGVIYPKVGWGRDSLTGIVVALRHLAERKESVSQIVSRYPDYTLLRKKKALKSRSEVEETLERVRTQYADQNYDQVDGLKIHLDRSWIHVRPSNTEPIMRCFIEAPTEEEAEALFAALPFE